MARGAFKDRCKNITGQNEVMGPMALEGSKKLECRILNGSPTWGQHKHLEFGPLIGAGHSFLSTPFNPPLCSALSDPSILYSTLSSKPLITPHIPARLPLHRFTHTPTQHLHILHHNALHPFSSNSPSIPFPLARSLRRFCFSCRQHVQVRPISPFSPDPSPVYLPCSLSPSLTLSPRNNLAFPILSEFRILSYLQPNNGSRS